MSKDRKLSGQEKEKMESGQYLTGNMDRDTVIALLRKEGFRVTKQRKILIDIILNEKCTCCKEIYCLASRQDRGIGIATIYRTINALENIGALKQKSPYQLCCYGQEVNGNFLIELDDGAVIELDQNALQDVIEKGIKQSGYSRGKKVRSIRHLHT